MEPINYKVLEQDGNTYYLTESETYLSEKLFSLGYYPVDAGKKEGVPTLTWGKEVQVHIRLFDLVREYEKEKKEKQ